MEYSYDYSGDLDNAALWLSHTYTASSDFEEGTRLATTKAVPALLTQGFNRFEKHRQTESTSAQPFKTQVEGNNLIFIIFHFMFGILI